MARGDPIEVIRELNRSWKERDFEKTREALLAATDWDDAVERYREAGLPVDPIDPDVEVVVDAFPNLRGPIGQRGRDAWIGFWQQWAGPLQDLALEDQVYDAYGDYVLVEMLVSALPRDASSRIEVQIFQVFAVKDGLIRLYAIYPNRDEALAAIPPGVTP